MEAFVLFCIGRIYYGGESMRSSDFLLQLKKALENDLSTSKVQEQVEYYRAYIKEEVKNGKTEEEVLEMLGDPWAIAKTILMEEEMNGSREHIEQETSEQQPTKNRQNIHIFGLDTWWKKALLILGVVAVIFLIISAILGIVSFLLPIILPVILIVTIFNLFRKK